jgi:hypothetical protein
VKSRSPQRIAMVPSRTTCSSSSCAWTWSGTPAPGARVCSTVHDAPRGAAKADPPPEDPLPKNTIRIRRPPRVAVGGFSGERLVRRGATALGEASGERDPRDRVVRIEDQRDRSGGVTGGVEHRTRRATGRRFDDTAPYRRFRSAVKSHQGRALPPLTKCVNDMNTSRTHGSCRTRVAAQSIS